MKPAHPLAAALLSATLAGAANAGTVDARLVTRLYNADEVVRIEGRTGVQASITFGEGEHIENVGIGDSVNWQVTPNKRANLLFVKPLSANARTNMTVVTDSHTYFFDLAASPSARPLYALRFRYLEPTKPAPANLAGEVLSAEEIRAASAIPGEKPVDPARLNFAWNVKGDSKLFPARIYDDGASTYLSWAVGAPIPAIQLRDEKGAEGPVNYAVRGDVIVVDGVPPLLVLRSGRDAATLENRGAPRKPVAPADTLAAAVAPPSVSAEKGN